MDRVYTIAFIVTVPPIPAPPVAQTWDLSNPSREMKIKSIVWDLTIFDTTAQNMLPIEQNTLLDFQFVLSNPAGNIAHTFSNFAGGATVLQNGSLSFFKPFKQRFDSFFVSQIMNLSLGSINYSAAKTFDIYHSVIIEVEEKIKYL